MDKKNVNKSEEKQLLEEIKKDSSKFGIIFDEYYPDIFGYIFRRVGDFDSARDISSETFLKAFLNINTFKWRDVAISSWLYRIAGNEIMQYHRKRKYKPQSLDSIVDATNWDTPDPESTNEEKARLEKEMTNQQDFVEIQQKIKKLPQVHQEALTLRYFEQKSILEVATILQKSEGTIKSLLSRGIEKLKKA